MFVNVLANFCHALACGLEALLKLGFGFDLGLAERHLHAAVSIDFSFARSFNGQENHVFKLVDHRRLHSVGLRRRHASERLERQHHVAQFVNRVVHILADFQVSLAAARELVIKRMRQVSQFGL